jgi:exodeoxyribonuclease X
MSRDTFLGTVSVLDTETTNLYPDKAEIVEVAGATYDGHRWQISDLLLGAENGIPPEASAKNHISNRMIDGLPRFADSQDAVRTVLGWDSRYLVAHNCKYDQEVLMYAWANAGSANDAEIAADRDRWICTHRLSKQLLNVDFPDMQYNLSYLRYKLDLPVPDELGAHRANADTLTCALLFEFLVDYALATDRVTNGPDLGEQLHELCWKPLVVTTWPFGKNRGKPLSEIDTDYYLWAMENMDALNEDKDGYDADLAASVAAELERRLQE